MARPEPALQLRDLVAGYTAKAAVLRRVSIDVEPGEAVGLLGPNGAGKTTLLRAISGLIHPRAGSIRLGNIDLGRMAPHAIARLGVAHIPERRQIFVRQTVRDNLLLGAMRSRAADERLDRVLAIFPSLHAKFHQLGSELSGGQLQMLAIARGLMSEPRLLLLDEPSLGLAPKLVDELGQRLHEIRRQLGTTLLVVEQSVRLALSTTERAYVLRRGEIVLERMSSDLLGDPELLHVYLR